MYAKKIFSSFATLPLLFALWGCDGDTTSVEETHKDSQDEPKSPDYYFHIFGTEPDDGQGEHWPGTCQLQDDHENFLLFSIHSPGERNGGGKGGSNPPSLSFSRSMKMEWRAGVEGNKYQKYDFDLSMRFERAHDLIADKVDGLNNVATVRFGKEDVPVFRVDEVTKPGILKGYHAWFRLMETNQPPYLGGVTGNLYGHLHLKTIGRYMPDKDPWTEEILTSVYESFYTQDCFVDYLKQYGGVREDAIVKIID